MKKLFLMILISSFLSACKTTNATTTARDTTSKAAADTALGGDRLKDASKP